MAGLSVFEDVAHTSQCSNHRLLPWDFDLTAQTINVNIIGQEEVCMYLRELLRLLRGTVILLLDNSSTHKGKTIEQFLDKHQRLRIEYFPSYAPQLNPDEGLWTLAKRELANSCPENVDELMEDILGSIDGIRKSQKILRGGKVRIGFLRLLNLRMQRQPNCQQGSRRRVRGRDVSVVNAHGSSCNRQAKAQSTRMLAA
jgi:transposase